MKTRIFFICLFVSLFVSAQISPEDLRSKSIESQFKDTYDNSTDWKKYKMIEKSYFRIFQKTVLDSVVLLKKDIKIKLKNLKKDELKIDSLNTKITGLETQLNSFKGAETNNKNIQTILLGIIGGLLLALIFFIYKFRKSNVVTKSTKVNLMEIEEEFEGYRKRALEKEQKLRRQLQDEINKQRGVM